MDDVTETEDDDDDDEEPAAGRGGMLSYCLFFGGFRGGGVRLRCLGLFFLSVGTGVNGGKQRAREEERRGAQRVEATTSQRRETREEKGETNRVLGLVYEDLARVGLLAVREIDFN